MVQIAEGCCHNFPEIVVAVLGMVAGLSDFAKGKTRQNRNEPGTAKMTHGQGEEKVSHLLVR